MKENKKIPDIRSKVLEFYDSIRTDSQHRYKSWEHCYAYFYTHKGQLHNTEILDKAALHLGMYLASWGMFRGSSGLLWKDYTIFKDLLVIIEPAIIRNDTNEIITQIGTFFSNIQVIRNKKDVNHCDEDFSKDSVTPTITLVSKILLGINASSVALDEYVCDGIKKICDKNFYQKSYTAIPDALNKINIFNEEHKKEIYELQSEITLQLGNGIKVPYPYLKLLDMYFFQIGERKSNKNYSSTGEK